MLRVERRLKNFMNLTKKLSNWVNYGQFGNLPVINKSVLFSAPIRSGHSHFKKKLNKVNINDFPWTYQS